MPTGHPIETPIVFVWDNFGPMHNDRCEAVACFTKRRVIGLEMYQSSDTYDWVSKEAEAFERLTLMPGNRRGQRLAILRAMLRARRKIGKADWFLCHYERPEIFLFAMALAGYTRSSSVVAPVIISDVDAPAGLACRMGLTSNDLHLLSRADINTTLSARTTERVQMLAQIRFTSSNTFQRAGLGRSSGGLITGLRIARSGVDQNLIGLQFNADVNTGTNLTPMVSGLADRSCHWIRLEVDGLTIRARTWPDGDAEPGTWVSRTEATAITFNNFNTVLRNGNPCLEVLGYSIGIALDAPAF